MIDYPGEVSTPTSYLKTMKLHVNIAISELKSRYMCMYVKDLLPEQPYGQGIIHCDSEFNDTKINF